MRTGKRILLVSKESLLHDRILENAGYSVTWVKSIMEARQAWQTGQYALVLISATATTQEASEFCDELKSIYPPQCVALLTGWYTFVPRDSCPDDAIPRGEGPAAFITRVAELVAKP